MLRISTRNARYQQWESLLGNRGKRQRAREFVVQGVRPITLAAEYGWRFRALIYDGGRPLSSWAERMLRDVDAVRVAMSPGLLAELGEKTEDSPELVAVVEMPQDDLDRIEAARQSFAGPGCGSASQATCGRDGADQLPVAGADGTRPGLVTAR